MELDKKELHRIFLLDVHEIFNKNLSKELYIGDRGLEVVEVLRKGQRFGNDIIHIMFEYKGVKTQVYVAEGGLGMVNQEEDKYHNLYLYYDNIEDNELITIDTFRTVLETHLKEVMDEMDAMDAISQNRVDLSGLDFR